jgi:hypothetical protein
VCRILVGKSEEKRLLGKQRGWVDNIKTDVIRDGMG